MLFSKCNSWKLHLFSVYKIARYLPQRHLTEYISSKLKQRWKKEGFMLNSLTTSIFVLQLTTCDSYDTVHECSLNTCNMIPTATPDWGISISRSIDRMYRYCGAEIVNMETSRISMDRAKPFYRRFQWMLADAQLSIYNIKVRLLSTDDIQHINRR